MEVLEEEGEEVSDVLFEVKEDEEEGFEVEEEEDEDEKHVLDEEELFILDKFFCFS